MITDAGKTVVKRFFARQRTVAANVLAIGVGTTTVTGTDVKLAFEVYRTPIIGTFYDPDTDRVIFKAEIPAGQVATVYEIGLLYDPLVSDISRLIRVNDIPGTWTGGALNSSNARVSAQTLKVDATTSSSTTASITGAAEDISAYVSTDSVAVAFFADANLSSVKLRLGADSSNYIEFTYSGISAGYNVKRVNVSAAVTTGTPDLTNLDYVAVVATATGGGATSLYLDGIRFEDNNISDPDNNILVSRLVSTLAIDADLPNEVEYALEIDFA